MESANWPASLRIVARVFPSEERTLASSIFTSGTSVAALITPGLILAILAMSGWRWAFVVVGAFGFLWVPLWLFYARRSELSGVWSSSSIERRESQSQGSVYSQLVRSGQFWCVLVIAVSVDPVCTTAPHGERGGPVRSVILPTAHIATAPTSEPKPLREN